MSAMCSVMAAPALLTRAAPLARRLAASPVRSSVGTPPPRHTTTVRALAADASNVDDGQKVCVITGANTGLGFISAREIAGKGYKVVMACRDLARGQKAAAEAGPSHQITVSSHRTFTW